MRVLVTGNAGHIGREQVRLLREAGYEVRTFDRVAGARDWDWEHIPGDLRDLETVRRAMHRIDAVVHLGAIPSDRRGSGEDVMDVNVRGTWNILMACVEAGVERVVNFSSINALGCVGGHKPGIQLPITDAYPRHPMSPYQLSKHLGEEMCRSFTDKHGLITISLRPGAVIAHEHYTRYHEWSEERRIEWERDEYWAYVDRRDVCEATLLALNAENIQNDAFLLLADDTTLKTPSIELIDRYYKDVPWIVDRDAYFADNPNRSLIDCTHAKEALGWSPKHSWRTHA